GGVVVCVAIILLCFLFNMFSVAVSYEEWQSRGMPTWGTLSNGYGLVPEEWGVSDIFERAKRSSTGVPLMHSHEKDIPNTECELNMRVSVSDVLKWINLIVLVIFVFWTVCIITVAALPLDTGFGILPLPLSVNITAVLVPLVYVAFLGCYRTMLVK